jgi:hypothetical protein
MNFRYSGKETHMIRMHHLPSIALLVAIMALVVSLGGTAYAVNQIDGRQLRNRSVPAQKIVKKSLTGTEINVSRLGVVPRAKLADKVASLIPFQKRMSIGAPEVTILTAGPFTVKGRCNLNGTQLAPTIVASTSENDAIGFSVDFAGVTANAPDFDQGRELVLDSYQEASPVPNASSATASLVSASGTSVTIDTLMASRVFSDSPAARTGCAFSGSAVVDRL